MICWYVNGMYHSCTVVVYLGSIGTGDPTPRRAEATDATAPAPEGRGEVALRQGAPRQGASHALAAQERSWPGGMDPEGFPEVLRQEQSDDSGSWCSWLSLLLAFSWVLETVQAGFVATVPGTLGDLEGVVVLVINPVAIFPSQGRLGPIFQTHFSDLNRQLIEYPWMSFVLLEMALATCLPMSTTKRYQKYSNSFKQPSGGFLK